MSSLPEELATLVLEMERDYIPLDYSYASMSTEALLEMVYGDAFKLEAEVTRHSKVQNEPLVKSTAPPPVEATKVEGQGEEREVAVAVGTEESLPLDLTLPKKPEQGAGKPEDRQPPTSIIGHQNQNSSAIPSSSPMMTGEILQRQGSINLRNFLYVKVGQLEQEQIKLMKTNAGLRRDKIEAEQKLERFIRENHVETTSSVQRLEEEEEPIEKGCLHDKPDERKAAIPHPDPILSMMKQIAKVKTDFEDATDTDRKVEEIRGLDSSINELRSVVAKAMEELTSPQKSSMKRKSTPQEKAADVEVALPRKRGRPRKRPLPTEETLPKREASGAIDDDDDDDPSSDNDSLFVRVVKSRSSSLRKGNRKSHSRRG